MNWMSLTKNRGGISGAAHARIATPVGRASDRPGIGRDMSLDERTFARVSKPDVLASRLIQPHHVLEIEVTGLCCDWGELSSAEELAPCGP